MKIYYILALLCCSCSVTKDSMISDGVYNYISNDYKCKLTIQKDNSFLLIENYFNDVSSQCNGNLKYIAKDTILLVCSDEKFPAQISGGYMNKREHIVIILNKKEIKFKNILLKK